jgi:DNA-binding CsgD family transcriptional regulator
MMTTVRARDLSKLTIRQLQVLQHLLSSQSVSQTAQVMAMHQSGVSSILAKLRDQLGGTGSRGGRRRDRQLA